MTTNIKDFYLNTPMALSKYMHLKLSNLPESVVQHKNMAGKPPEMDMCVWGLS